MIGLPALRIAHPRPALAVGGRVVLITGAGRGIGFALARDLYRRGAAVAVVDVDPAAADRAAAELGVGALAVTADVTDRAAMAAAVRQTIDRFGRLDVVVANAGVAPRPATLRVMADEDFDRVLAVNLTGVYNTVRAALEHVIARSGHVVVVSSAAAFSPGAGGSPYMISKAAVEQFGRALRLELAGHGVSVQIAYFGIVGTAMTDEVLDTDDLGRRLGALLPWPLNRRITAEQAAAALADGLTRRAPVTVAPAPWQLYGWLRGLINPLLDRALARDARLRTLLADLESRFAREPGPKPAPPSAPAELLVRRPEEHDGESHDARDGRIESEGR